MKVNNICFILTYPHIDSLELLDLIGHYMEIDCIRHYIEI